MKFDIKEETVKVHVVGSIFGDFRPKNSSKSAISVKFVRFIQDSFLYGCFIFGAFWFINKAKNRDGTNYL